MDKITLLFLGAGKLWQLMRCFQEDARALGVSLDLHSMELDRYCPVADMARIHIGPRFDRPEAADAILSLSRDIGADLVIPNADSATVLLARLRDQLSRDGSYAVVSDASLCQAMYDKIASESWFGAHGDRRPMPTSKAPSIAKHRFGYASKGIYPLPTADDYARFVERPDAAEYLIQEYVHGDEYSVDAYVDRSGRIVDLLTRQRLVVEAGIVLNSRTRWNEAVVDACKAILARPGWLGPQTLQFRMDGDVAKIIEINPRFGGGVTHAIHCGLRMPRWLMEEHLGRPIVHTSYVWPRDSVMTRARIDIFHDRSS